MSIRRHPLIRVDLNQHYIGKIYLQEGEDEGTILPFQLTQDGQVFSLDDLTINILLIKSDNTKVLNACTITDAAAGRFEYVVTAQTVSKAGDATINLQLMRNGKHAFSGRLLGEVEPTGINTPNSSSETNIFDGVIVVIAAAKAAAEAAEQNAASSATTATNAAETASSAATLAQTAKAGAETAKFDAETARADTIAAKTAAQVAQSAAEAARTGAETAKIGADTAKTAAETAKAGAEAAETGAISAKAGAETAETATESAKATVEGIRDSLAATVTAAEQATSSANSAAQNVQNVLSGAVATPDTKGLMDASDKAKLDGIAPGANNYALPAATATTLGGVKVGNNLSVTSEGVLNADAPSYEPVSVTADGLMRKEDKTALDALVAQTLPRRPSGAGASNSWVVTMKSLWETLTIDKTQVIEFDDATGVVTVFAYKRADGKGYFAGRFRAAPSASGVGWSIYKSEIYTYDGAVWSAYVEGACINNLTSTSTTSALAAAQGKELADRIGDKAMLTTVAKEDLVSAINEVSANASLPSYPTVNVITPGLQSIPHLTNTFVQFQNPAVNQICEVDAASKRVKIKKEGVYAISVTAGFAGNPNGVRIVNTGPVTSFAPKDNTTAYVSLSMVKKYNVGDLVYFVVTQTSGGGLDILASGNTRMDITYII